MDEDNRKADRHQSGMTQNSSSATAKIEERIGLLFAVLALVVSAVALTVSIMSNGQLRDQVIKTETELQLVDDWLVTHGVRKGSDGRYHFVKENANGD